MSSERPGSQSTQAFADVLRDAREHAGVTAADLAARAGIAPSDYEAIERAETAPKLEAIVDIARGLGLSGEELLARARL